MFSRCFHFLYVIGIFAPAVAFKPLGYRFKLDIGNPDVLCPSPDYVCPDGNIHYLCRANQSVNKRCRYFKPIPLSLKLIQTFVEATNGIRNKVATDFGIANMNLIYWSEGLSDMAARYLRECLLEYDPCMIVGEKQIRVCQNHAYFKGKMSERWPGRIVRRWYLEVGHNTTTWRLYMRKHKSGELTNITNMIYPLAEFIGCSGAHMFTRNFIVCYYHPPYDRSTFPKNFARGTPCTKCSSERSKCSKTFAGLCGLDFKISGVEILHWNLVIILICCFSMLFFPY